jgi:large subunit ribosomal protein L25
MKTAYKFDAESRKIGGTGAARALRNAGKVPAVLYGKGGEALLFSVIHKDLKREYTKGGFFGKLVTIAVDGEEIICIPKELQIHPVNDSLVHADFIRVNAGEEVKATVPVRFINRERCLGIRRGGNLNVVRFDVELICDASNIPEKIEIDLLNVNIGESIHISKVNLPAGVRPAIERDFTLAAIAGKASKVAEGEAA